MGVTHISVQMYGYMFKLPIFVCDLGYLDYMFGMDAGRITGFVTCAHTGRIWFNGNETGQPEQLSRSSCNAICHLRAVKRIKLKPFKAGTIEVAYAKRALLERVISTLYYPLQSLGRSWYDHDGWSS